MLDFGDACLKVGEEEAVGGTTEAGEAEEDQMERKKRRLTRKKP